MIAVAPKPQEPIQKRLSMQVEGIAEDTITLRSQDWDRERLAIEFG